MSWRQTSCFMSAQGQMGNCSTEGWNEMRRMSCRCCCRCQYCKSRQGVRANMHGHLLCCAAGEDRAGCLKSAQSQMRNCLNGSQIQMRKMSCHCHCCCCCCRCQKRRKRGRRRRGSVAGASAAEIWRWSWLGTCGLICARHQDCRGCAPPLLACMPRQAGQYDATKPAPPLIARAPRQVWQEHHAADLGSMHDLISAVATA